MTELRARLAEVLARTEHNPLSLTANGAAHDFLRDPALARALEDAARYAWLRENPGLIDWDSFDWTAVSAEQDTLDLPRLLDIAIDAAIAARSEG